MGSEKSAFFMITACLIGAALFVVLAAAVITENKMQTADDGNLVLLPADSETFGFLGIVPVSSHLNDANGMMSADPAQNDTSGTLPTEPESNMTAGSSP